MIFRRFFALLIDKLILTVAFLIMFLPIMLIARCIDAFSPGFESSAIYPLLKTLLWVICGIAIPCYFAYFESSKAQGTPGKQLLDIKLIDMYGVKLDSTEAFLRFIGASFINVTVILPVISIIFMLVNKDGKMLHDLFFNTRVVRR